jgi:hypothetical protein
MKKSAHFASISGEVVSPMSSAGKRKSQTPGLPQPENGTGTAQQQCGCRTNSAQIVEQLRFEAQLQGSSHVATLVEQLHRFVVLGLRLKVAVSQNRKIASKPWAYTRSSHPHLATSSWTRLEDCNASVTSSLSIPASLAMRTAWL